MKSLRLGDVSRFPLPRGAVAARLADGYQLLNELGAVDDANELTATGAELAKLPLDPRVGRMILEARSQHAPSSRRCFGDRLGARTCKDVRDRPMEAQH